MKENPKSEPDAVPARGGAIRSNTPPEKPVESDAPRKTFGDPTEGGSLKDNPSRIDDERGPETHRYGDRTAASEFRDQGPPREPSQSSGQEQRAGSTRQDPQGKPEAKSGSGHGSTRKGPEGERDAKSKSNDVKPAKPNSTQGGTHRRT